MKLNVEYMYAFSCKCKYKAVMIFCFDDPDKAIEVLQKEDINLMSSVELLDLD